MSRHYWYWRKGRLVKHIGCTNELREEKGELVLTDRSHNEQEDCTIGGRQRETKATGVGLSTLQWDLVFDRVSQCVGQGEVPSDEAEPFQAVARYWVNWQAQIGPTCLQKCCFSFLLLVSWRHNRTWFSPVFFILNEDTVVFFSWLWREL